VARQRLLTLHEYEEAGDSPLQQRLYQIIYLANTPAGRWFDLLLIWAILLSVLAMMLDTVESLHKPYGSAFRTFEWIITGLFTVEYALRLYCVRHPLRYARSFFGIVDLLAILPFYLSLFIAGTEYLMVIRALRILRVFRILKMVRYVEEGRVLVRALADSWHKIVVFYVFVLILVTIFGSLAYVIEGPENGFTSIPESIYWAIVTVTTTGYGDITPQTLAGRLIASLVMITGYAVIAVPTGIFTVEMFRGMRRRTESRQCPHCGEYGHEMDARYCHHCGGRLP
jgi:voltage-gated potassium channel